MNGERRIRFFPRAVLDPEKLDARFVRQILDDIAILGRTPWPPGRVKRLRGGRLWEVKTGSFRSLFVTERAEVVVVRIVNRRDLERAIGRIDVRTIFQWLRES
jgi:mRNA-degrading endonuclease RelE of RelBE toxin-antitoxin system